jgi:putative adhesin
MTTQTQDGVVSHGIGPDGLVVLRVHDGTIRIRGVGGEVATVRAADGGAIEGLEIETGERSLSIASRRGFELLGPDFPGFGRRDRAGRGRTKDLQLEIPAGAAVIVEGASADVDVRGMHGDQRYRSASGDLVLADVRGSLTIEAVSGDIEIGTDGPSTVTARSVSGDLDLRAGSLAELHATTTSGDLHITGRFDGDGPYAIVTVSGDATLAPLNDVRIEARSITGDIDSDLPSRRDDAAGRRALIIGSGGPTVTFRSTSGDIRVVAANGPTRTTQSASPAPPAPPAPRAPAAPPAPASPPDAPAAPNAQTDVDPRLAILRELERGDIDVAEAGRRLEALDIGAAAADAGEEPDHA